MSPAELRKLIAKLLHDLHRPMTSIEIQELLRVRHGVDATTPSIGSNLGYLRAAGIVERRNLPKWGKPYWFNGAWRFQTENWWWHTAVVSQRMAQRFCINVRREVEAKARDLQRGRGRPVTYRLKARTDDMRQMVDDLTINQQRNIQ